ncbi:MAG: hypothetical protein Q9170_006625 [Blastenia crenularia]
MAALQLYAILHTPCVTTTSPEGEKMPLMALSPELLDNVVKQVPHRHDLSKLSRTCKILRDAVTPRLYSRLIIQIPRIWSRLRIFEELLATNPEGLKYVKSLSIVPQLRQLSWMDAEEDRTHDVQVESISDGIDLPNSSASAHLNTMVRILLRRVPPGQLSEFNWTHTANMDDATFQTVVENQNFNLGTLNLPRYVPCMTDWDNLKIPGIRCLSLGSIFESNSTMWTADLVIDNQASLRHLCLGAEPTGLRRYHIGGEQWQDDIDSTVSEVADNIQDFYKDKYSERLSESSILDLETCEIKGITVWRIINPVFALFNLGSLTSLSLESCRGLEDLFHMLTTHKNKYASPDLRLRSFYLRHEDSDQHFRRLLVNFLCSIPGLSHLSILLEIDYDPQSFTPVLEKHGASLQSLVWEERVERRQAFQMNTGYPPYNILVDIAEHCTQLAELGISVDWYLFQTEYWNLGPSDMVYEPLPRLLGTPYKLIPPQKALSALTTMRYLQTLNIRNQPSINGFHWKAEPEQLHQGFANHVLDAVCNRHNTPASPPLQTLAIGSSTYRDVYYGLSGVSSRTLSVYEYLQVRVFSMESWYRPSGQRKLSAKLTETGTYEMTEAAGGRVEVLKPYWLG